MLFPLYHGIQTYHKQELRKQYCPPLDDALFLSLTLERDLTDTAELNALTETLDSLREDAVAQQNADFDPSGTGAAAVLETNSLVANQKSRSSYDESSISGGFASSTNAGSEERSEWEPTLDFTLEGLTLDEKLEYLKGVFQTVEPREIEEVLQRCNGVLAKATDEILNLVFLTNPNDVLSDGDFFIPKGVDGFAQDDRQLADRRSKSKRRKWAHDSLHTSPARQPLDDASNGKTNAWTAMQTDVDFICTRTSLKPGAIKSLYHEVGANLPVAIQTLAIREGSEFKSLDELDHESQDKILHLQTSFPSIPEPQLFGLMKLCNGRLSIASELAQAMLSSLESSKPERLTNFTPYQRPQVPTQDMSTLQLSETPQASLEPQTWTPDSAAQAMIHRQAAAAAFSHAGDASRRGRSSPHMGGVVAHHTARGHEHLKTARAWEAIAADHRASKQSSATWLDLHGISVKDAKRIALEKTERWWESLGDAKYAPGGGGPAREGFRIVTGAGKHSKNGVSKLGPAVFKKLKQAGWKVEVHTAEIIVTGKIWR